MMELNRIYNVDCLELMKTLPDKCIDMILADPPYNVSKLNDQRDRSKLNSPIMRRDKEINYDFGEWDNMEREDFLTFTKDWLKECCRILKDGGTIISFFNKEDISLLGWEAKNYNVRTRTILSWHKTNPVPSFRKVNYLSACEFAWVGSKGDKSWTFNFQQQKEMHNFYETPNASSYGETIHPTEKPKAFFEWLIEIHSNKGDIIFDPFLGSGTTAIVAQELGRNYIGCELDKDYFEIAQKRLGFVKQRLF